MSNFRRCACPNRPPSAQVEDRSRRLDLDVRATASRPPGAHSRRHRGGTGRRAARRPDRVRRGCLAPLPHQGGPVDNRPRGRGAVRRLRRRDADVVGTSRAAPRCQPAPQRPPGGRRTRPDPPRRPPDEEVGTGTPCARWPGRAGARRAVLRRRRLAPLGEADRAAGRDRDVAEGARAESQAARQARRRRYPRDHRPTAAVAPTARRAFTNGAARRRAPPDTGDARPPTKRATPWARRPTWPSWPARTGGATTRAAPSSPTPGYASHRARPAHRAAR